MNEIKQKLRAYWLKVKAWWAGVDLSAYRKNVLKAAAGIAAACLLGLLLRGCWPEGGDVPPVPDDDTSTWVIYGLANGEMTAEGRNCVPPKLSRSSARRMLDSLKRQVTEPETGEEN